MLRETIHVLSYIRTGIRKFSNQTLGKLLDAINGNDQDRTTLHYKDPPYSRTTLCHLGFIMHLCKHLIGYARYKQS